MTEHLSSEQLADYLSGLLDESESNELEDHLFSCRTCADESEGLFGLAVAIHAAVPPVLSPEQFQALSAGGRVVAVNSMSPEQTAEVQYPPEGKLLVHRFGGADLRDAHRVDVDLVDLEGQAVARLDNVPFDAARGEVLVACQSHFADYFPPDAVFKIEVALADERTETRSYTVFHRA